MKVDQNKEFYAKVHQYRNGSYKGSFIDSFDTLDQVRVWAKSVGKTGDVLEISRGNICNGPTRRIVI